MERREWNRIRGRSGHLCDERAPARIHTGATFLIGATQISSRQDTTAGATAKATADRVAGAKSVTGQQTWHKRALLLSFEPCSDV